MRAKNPNKGHDYINGPLKSDKPLTEKEMLAEAKPIDLLINMRDINNAALFNGRRNIKRLMKEKEFIENIIKIHQKYSKKIPIK